MPWSEYVVIRDQAFNIAGWMRGGELKLETGADEKQGYIEELRKIRQIVKTDREREKIDKVLNKWR